MKGQEAQLGPEQDRQREYGQRQPSDGAVGEALPPVAAFRWTQPLHQGKDEESTVERRRVLAERGDLLLHDLLAPGELIELQ